MLPFEWKFCLRMVELCHLVQSVMAVETIRAKILDVTQHEGGVIGSVAV